MGYLCDTCKHARPAKRTYTTSDGKNWEYGPGRYVRCRMTKQWTIEKRSDCPVYEKDKRK